MDLDEFRSFVLDSGVDVWTWINMAISMASTDYENELKIRRDGIIQKLYATSSVSKCRNCDYQTVEGAECEENVQNRDIGYDDSFNEEDDQRKILDIRNLLDDQNQEEIDLIGHLQRLVDMEITFKVLKDTDIGRHVTGLRKHSSNEVRSLVKILVRKWKEIVDEWVRKNPPVEEMTPSRDAPDSNTQASSYSTPSKGKTKIKRIEQEDSKLLHGNYKDSQYEPLYENKKQKTSDFNHIPKTKHPIYPSKEPVKYW